MIHQINYHRDFFRVVLVATLNKIFGYFGTVEIDDIIFAGNADYSSIIILDLESRGKIKKVLDSNKLFDYLLKHEGWSSRKTKSTEK